jgi:hypothetical protein
MGIGMVQKRELDKIYKVMKELAAKFNADEITRDDENLFCDFTLNKYRFCMGFSPEGEELSKYNVALVEPGDDYYHHNIDTIEEGKEYIENWVLEVIKHNELLKEAEEEPRFTGKFVPGENPHYLYQGGKFAGRLKTEYEEKKLTKKQEELIYSYEAEVDKLEDEIYDLKNEIEELKYRKNGPSEHEIEQYMSDIQERYGSDVLDLLNSGIENKLDELRNMGIDNAKNLIIEHDYYTKEQEDNSEEINEFKEEIKKRKEKIENFKIKIDKLENNSKAKEVFIPANKF